MLLDWLKAVTAFLDPYSALISAFAAVLTAIIAIIAIAATALDSKDRTRPVVLAEFRMSKHSDTAFELVVRNYGGSSARNLKVTFDPPFGDTHRANDFTGRIATRYDTHIAWLPPAAELTNTWWAGINTGGQELENRLLTPDRVRVTVSYKGNRIRRFTDTFELYKDMIALTTRTTSSTSTPGRMASITKSLSSLVDGVKAMNTNLTAIATRLKDS